MGTSIYLPTSAALTHSGSNETELAKIETLHRELAKQEIDSAWWCEISRPLRQTEPDSDWEWHEIVSKTQNVPYFEAKCLRTPDASVQAAMVVHVKQPSSLAKDKTAVFVNFVVHLMTELLQPQPGESNYDPTCGSGGMLLSCVTHLRRQNKEWRTLKLFGQDRNLMTSGIARMNCFLHGIEDFQIQRADTLGNPQFVSGDRLQQFDVCLANPPYSIKQWDRAAFSADPWGRNIYGTPPRGRADYAFWQHIIQSLDSRSGRCAILFPHGVLFRNEEAEMRKNLVEHDVIDCVLGLGPNLFYNSPMEACVVVCRMKKPKKRKGKIQFINAVGEITRERAQSFLTDDHIRRIVSAYKSDNDQDGFSRLVPLDEIRSQQHNLNIPLYVRAETTNGNGETDEEPSLSEAIESWQTSSRELRQSMQSLLESLKEVVET